MIARIETTLPASADAIFRRVQTTAAFRYITRGVLAFSNADAWPERFVEGDTIETRMWFFHVIPGWRHELRLVRIDDAEREILSNERGGPVSRWNHLIQVRPRDPASCRYADEIDIRAGLLTPLVWLYAHLFYRYRQRRWRRLAESLRRASG